MGSGCIGRVARVGGGWGGIYFGPVGWLLGAGLWRVWEVTRDITWVAAREVPQPVLLAITTI
jgi:hypothetical protein